MAVMVGKTDFDRSRPKTPQLLLSSAGWQEHAEPAPTVADEGSRYKKIIARHKQIEEFFVETFPQLNSA